MCCFIGCRICHRIRNTCQTIILYIERENRFYVSLKKYQQSENLGHLSFLIDLVDMGKATGDSGPGFGRSFTLR